jgi:hypothetical protein
MHLDIEDSTESGSDGALKLQGLKSAVDMARVLIEAQLEYLDKFEECVTTGQGGGGWW